MEMFICFVLKKRRQSTFYLTLPDLIGSEPMGKTYKQSKGTSQQISYLIKMIHTGQRSQTSNTST